ncbi:nicotinate-nucleotide--dimethylbenzimidazole phosphoribosyltransferase [Chelativorans sp. ZYF759]|uniref:nicotinate-nucleotide--dimethylbenzimidazole phosphoribosyltransferase n=1 Tax=Chelativorans sp. ZYF759 TaxID=2692213 RepID=UPI00145D2CCF|nr:nicotinate-nucleotide--dimethylbenzimidazole phosphoribosyltransferase [Chelativorans sp. ZYF759]NMG39597.1 nicotinate-nucleotide--dimethylbenzimidazole phosphoribosyltransferase [Chelativorans sp. ZYF759]
MAASLPTGSFAELKFSLSDLRGPDASAMEAARQRQLELTKPPGSLGMLEDLAVFLAGWQAREKPILDRAQALIFAGNHGVCAQGVNPFPQEVTAQMVGNFQNGGAAINQLCLANGCDLGVIALELDRPTGDISQGPAMDEAETLDALRQGAEAVDPQAQLLVLGEMGIGNSTIAAALACAVFGGNGADWAGPGTGADTEGVSLKARVVDRAVEANRAAIGDPLATLAALGGREQAAICGAVLEARARRIVVILDGFICTSAAAVLHPFAGALDHCVAGHVSAEPGHQRLLAAIGKTPLLSLGMRLGEGSGAALAVSVLRSAVACHNGMATFAEAGVAGG